MKEMAAKKSTATDVVFSFGKMQAYFCYCKQFNPKMTEAASRQNAFEKFTPKTHLKNTRRKHIWRVKN
jgi:capsule polysaccharide export protein KpsC/LpsZ